MSFLKETDYHGSRTYGREPADQELADHFRLRVWLIFAWARLQIEKVMRLGAVPTQTSALRHRGKKGFTLLGIEQRVLPARRQITNMFPISASTDRARKIRSNN